MRAVGGDAKIVGMTELCNGAAELDKARSLMSILGERLNDGHDAHDPGDHFNLVDVVIDLLAAAAEKLSAAETRMRAVQK